MMSARMARRAALAAGAAALIGMGTLTACTQKEKPAENSPPSGSSSSATVSPTEKGVPAAITPGAHAGSGPQNSFAPTVTARPAPTALPGNVITGG